MTSRENRVSRQVAAGVQVELCLLCLPPSFPAVPHHFNLSQLVPAPRRTVRAQLTHTDPQTIIRALIERPDAEQFCSYRFPASVCGRCLPTLLDHLSLPLGGCRAYSRSLSSYRVELFLREQRQGLPDYRAVSMSRMPWSSTPRKRTPPCPLPWRPC